MISYTIDKPQGLVVIRLSGKLSLQEAANHFATMAQDPDFDRRMNSLILATDNDSIPPFSLLKQFNPIVSEWARQRGRVKWAFVLEAGEIKTLAEISLRELDLHEVQIQCFTSEDVARRWLSTSC